MLLWVVEVIVLDYLAGWAIILLLRWRNEMEWISIKEFWSAFYLPLLFIGLGLMVGVMWVLDLKFLFKRLFRHFRKQEIQFDPEILKKFGLTGGVD